MTTKTKLYAVRSFDVTAPDQKTGSDAVVYCPACKGRLATWNGDGTQYKALIYGGHWPEFVRGNYRLETPLADVIWGGAARPIKCPCGVLVKLPSHTVVFRRVVRNTHA